MRIYLLLGCLLIPVQIANSIAQDLPQANAPLRALLCEASELAQKQEKHQRYWTDCVLLEIGEVQIRAGDFEGGLRSIRGSDYDYGRGRGLYNLTIALVRSGKKDRAFEIIQSRGPDGFWPQESLKACIELPWVEYL